VLHSFAGGSDGADPAYAGVIADNQGALYGTTSAGGNGGGIVLMLTPSTFYLLRSTFYLLPSTFYQSSDILGG
jgi:hypothetical protein